MANKRICVIGAGPAGLVVIKSCLEEDHEVVSYEKSDAIGGLWRYRDEDIEGLPSVTKSTVINSSKEMTAISDFPPPSDAPNYMGHKLILKYLEAYADKFELLKHVKLSHEVVEVTPHKTHSETGRWRVKFREPLTDEVKEEVFDAVVAATGHHVKPNLPQFPGQNLYKGKIMHTHSYKTHAGFEDKVVVVIGIGNSGIDAATELSRISSQVYLSTRRGAWITDRVGPHGVPFDAFMLRRWTVPLRWLIGERLTSTLFEMVLNAHFDHAKYGLKPSHRAIGQHPTVGDGLPNCIITGRVKLKKNVERFTEEGVVFEGDDFETKCDAVIFATGYEISYPFLDSSILSVNNNKVQLYKNVFQPKIEHPETLAIVGLFQTLGGGFPAAELQCRWFARLMSGKVSLPSKSEMEQDIKKSLDQLQNLYYDSPRNTIQADYITYSDEIAEMVGVKPNMWKLFLTDPKLWYKLAFGPCVPYQYRLVGPHAWAGAREAIMSASERISAGLMPAKH